MGKVIGGVLGGILGAGGSGGSSHVEPHKVDREKFKIKGADQLRGRAMTREQEMARRGQQAGAATQGLMSDLQRQSRGEGPSLAEAQLKRAQDRTLAQQLAAIQTGGGNAAMRRRQAARQAAATQQDIAGQAAQARMQEQMRAQQLLGQVAGQEAAVTEQLAQRYLAQGFDMARAQQMAAADAERLQMQANLQAQGLQQAMARQKQGQQADAFAGAAEGLGSVLAGGGGKGGGLRSIFSDKNAKKNIKNADKDISSFLNALSAKGYNYKQPGKPGRAKGKNYGVMAQDLEKSKVGKAMVMDTPEGKTVNIPKGFGAVLASQAHMNNRLSLVEKAILKKQKKKA